jgi:3-oxoacyl-[acyl-carrier-protein] synthase II
MTKARRVVVTGMGIVSPLGHHPDVFFDALIAGQSGIARLKSEFTDKLDSKIAAQADFDPTAHFSKRQADSLDRISQFALCAARQAVLDADLPMASQNKARIGVALGTGMAGSGSTDEGYTRLFVQGATRLKPFTVLMAMNNAAASHIAMEYGLTGPNFTFSTACSSSAIAIGEACEKILNNRADVMLAGGAEALLTYGTLKAWEALRTLAKEDEHDASTSCKPFAADRSGLVLGEGAGMLVLEELDTALARGARIYAEITGYGCTNDAAHITQPSVDGQAAAIRAALDSAHLTPADIGYINAHGTSTLLNDSTETAAIKQVMGKTAYTIPVSSTKSMHGHLMGAAAAVEFIACIKVLTHAAIPPTCNLHRPDPACDLDYVPNVARTHIRVDHVMSNSFAFGGTSGVLIASRMQ